MTYIFILVCMYLVTVDHQFTEIIVGVCRIPIRIRRISSGVVVDDVSPLILTIYVHGVWYCRFSVDSIFKTSHAVFFVSCIWYVDWISKKSVSVRVIFIWNVNSYLFALQSIINDYKDEGQKRFLIAWKSTWYIKDMVTKCVIHTFKNALANKLKL